MKKEERQLLEQALAALELSWQMDAVASNVLPAIQAIREFLIRTSKQG